MNTKYKNAINHANREIVVSDKLVEFGNSTWQIKNIAGISVNSQKIILDIPEPAFYEAEPTLSLNLKAATGGFVVVWVLCLIFLNNGVGLFLGALAAGAVIYSGIEKHNANKSAWQARKNRTDKEKEVWLDMKNNPPIIHSISIETNSGSMPMLHSFDGDEIGKIANAIKKSMSSDSAPNLTFNIDAINVEGDKKIENIGSTIYNQTVAA